MNIALQAQQIQSLPVDMVQVALYPIVEAMFGLPIPEAGLAVVFPKQGFVCDITESAGDECNSRKGLLRRQIVEDLVDQLVGERIERAHGEDQIAFSG